MASSADTGGGLYIEPMLYDVVNTPQTAQEIDAMERVVKQHGNPGSSWLEPACGTGRYLRTLLRRGRQVAGYDPLPAMLRYAEHRLATIGDQWRLQAASFTDPATTLAGLGPVDVAFCPVNSLRHLHDDEQVLSHFNQVAALLDLGGIYLVGLDLHDPELAMVDEDVWAATRGSLTVQEVIQYLPPEDDGRREEVIVELMATRPRGTEHHSYSYALRTYTEQQWDRLVSRSALQRVGVHDAKGRPHQGTAQLPYQYEVLKAR